MIPSAKLRIECAMINPPKPLGCGVIVDGKVIATLTLEELEGASRSLEALKSERIVAGLDPLDIAY
jgi:hypothetical protein